MHLQVKPDGAAELGGMGSKSQDGDHKGEVSRLGKSGEWIQLEEGTEPQEVQERDWLGGGPNTSPGRIRKKVSQFERRAAGSPKTSKYMEDYQQSQGSCC